MYAVSCLTAWTDATLRLDWDSAVYIMTARSLDAGDGYAYQGDPFTLRPPALAWLLTFFAIDGDFDQGPLNAFVMLLAAGCVVAVFVVFRRLHGTLVALAAALLSGLSPAFVGNFNRILSEYPAQLLLFVGFGCALVADERRRHWWVWGALAGLALGAAVWFRTVAILALPGLFVAGLRQDDRWRWWRGALLPAGLALALALPWIAWSKSTLAEPPTPSERWLLHDYGTALLHEDPGDPTSPRVTLAGFAERVTNNGADLAAELANTCFGVEHLGVGSVLAALVVLGWALSVWRRPTVVDAFFAAYTILTLLYFTYAQRLALPLAPFAILYLLVVAQRFGEHLQRRATSAAEPSGRRTAGAVILVTALFAIGPARTLSDSLHPELREGGKIATRWADNVALAEWVVENTPDDAVLLCRWAPQLAVLTGRRTHTWRFRRDDGLLKRYDVDYVVSQAAPPAAVMREIQRASVRRWDLPGSSADSTLVIHQVR